MSLGFFSAFLQAGGKEAAKGLRDAAMSAAPNTSIKAGQIVQEGKLDDAGEVVQRTRRHLNEVQTQFDAVNGPYQQKLTAAEAIEQKLAGFQATIDDPNKSDDDKNEARRQLGLHNTSLAGLVAKIEAAAPELDHVRTELAETKEFLRQAEEAFKAKAARTVNSVQEAKDVRRQLDQANLEREQAKQREEDARVVAGLATEDDSENPAIAAMKNAVNKARDEADQHKFKAKTLTDVTGHKDEDDPIVKAALAETSGVSTAQGSLTDRLAALRQRAA